jgi:hypothetical protein
MRDYLTLIFGKPWVGKTERMLYEIRKERRAVLVDAKCSQLTKLSGWEHVWPEMDTEGRLWVDARVANSFKNKPAFRIAFHLRNHHRAQLELLARVLMAVKNTAVAIDELSLFVPPGPAGTLPRSITSIVISGSHDGLQIIGTSQRPSLVHATLRANANRLLMYRVDLRNDVEVLRDYLPDSLADQLRTLPDFVCLDWRDGRAPFVDRSLAGCLHTLPKDRF